MADTETAIRALKETRPPATDKFTYLTLIEEHRSPEVLPTLNEILQDPELTQDIGWDLVQLLLPIPGCEPCLETIARLGNPREVILKVLEVLVSLQDDADPFDGTSEDDGTEDEDEKDAVTTKKFITLLGMLAILHKRIKTKHPSRFLAATLRTVFPTYRPNPEMTASVVNLVHSLSGHKRPKLPSRKSSINVADPDEDGDASKNAPDPEAELEDPVEGEIQQKLLLSFVTCVIETYVNANDMQWSSRLLEYYTPERLVPGKRSGLQRFREEQDLLARDETVGRLVALTRDLGLSESPQALVDAVCHQPVRRFPLPDSDEFSDADSIHLSTGGGICVLAYWVFSSTAFKADRPPPELHTFPDHLALLERYMEDDAQGQIAAAPGIAEAIVAVGLWLHRNDRVVPTAADADADADAGPEPDFMVYLHHIALCALYSPAAEARNAAAALAGRVLHADPDEADRVRILEDLLENCQYATLKACAVAWLRDELVAAHPPAAASTPTTPTTTATTGGSGLFAGPEAVERLQYLVFPDLSAFRDASPAAALDHWQQNAPFLLQAANLAFFLFCRGGRYGAAVPAGMGAALELRYAEPLAQAAEGLLRAVEAGKLDVDGGAEHVVLDLAVLVDRLRSLSLS